MLLASDVRPEVPAEVVSSPSLMVWDLEFLDTTVPDKAWSVIEALAAPTASYLAIILLAWASVTPFARSSFAICSSPFPCEAASLTYSTTCSSVICANTGTERARSSEVTIILSVFIRYIAKVHKYTQNHPKSNINIPDAHHLSTFSSPHCP